MTSLNFKALLLAEKKRLLHQSVAVEPATTDVVLDELPLDLSQHVVDDTAKQVFYVPNFLNDNDASALLACVRDSSDLTWRVVGSRKTSHVGALPNGASASDAPQVPQFLVDQVKRLVRVHAVATVSHCLVNHYERGAGIHEHLDGPLYEPRVAVLSLGGDCVMEFLSRDKQRVVASLALRANSLLVFSGTFYTDLPHRIVARDADLIAAHCLNRAAADVAVGDTLTRGDTRISLTFRKAHNKRCWLDTAQHQSDALLFTESARDEARRREAAFVQMISEK